MEYRVIKINYAKQFGDTLMASKKFILGRYLPDAQHLVVRAT